MQAKTLLQIGFAPYAFQIFTHEDELEHLAQAMVVIVIVLVVVVVVIVVGVGRRY